MSGDHHSAPPDDGGQGDLQMQAAEYVLGTLDAARRRAIEARIAHEPGLRAAVQDWEQRLLPLTALAPPAEPTAALWQRIAASIAPARRAHPESRPSGRRWWQWDSLALWRGLAGSGFATAAVLAVLLW